ncbi:uncharacterized protein EI90DRAFT_3293410 [Cantharellus anzutake]|uniref:uncharacterized protein n=1 Tax=Cantharellus anzutake TaxID=1750568 RepID=UPI0019086B69|nr:uncharacterized protein EI90DRAFT_3293410 [Cantharellus anzutake]KAF8318052.1 hypothetical protein EI90DRAFT_3293410 [Cantharellus anzutake]
MPWNRWWDGQTCRHWGRHWHWQTRRFKNRLRLKKRARCFLGTTQWSGGGGRWGRLARLGKNRSQGADVSFPGVDATLEGGELGWEGILGWAGLFGFGSGGGNGPAAQRVPSARVPDVKENHESTQLRALFQGPPNVPQWVHLELRWHNSKLGCGRGKTRPPLYLGSISSNPPGGSKVKLLAVGMTRLTRSIYSGSKSIQSPPTSDAERFNTRSKLSP